MARPRSGRRGQGDDRSLGQVVSDLSGDLSTLMKQEIELAKVELKSEVGKVGKGAGMLGGAGLRAGSSSCSSASR